MKPRTLIPTSEQPLWGGITLAALAGIVILPLALPSVSLANEVLIFAIAALGCNLLLGHTGLLSFGQAIFFGGGAYLSSIALINGKVGLIGALLIGIAVGGVLAACVGALAIRRRGIYFVMLTLAFTHMAYFVAYTASDWTGGENGLLDIPRPDLNLFGTTVLGLSDGRVFYAAVAVLFMAVFIGLRRVINSPFGSTLAAIRENEERLTAIGYNTRWFKILAFTISGMVTGMAGALYAMFLGFAPLGNIEVAMSENILLMTIIGGTESLLGGFLGAAFLIIVGDALSSIWPRWMMGLGMLLIALVLFMRGGLWGALDSGLARWRNRKAASVAKEAGHV